MGSFFFLSHKKKNDVVPFPYICLLRGDCLSEPLVTLIVMVSV